MSLSTLLEAAKYLDYLDSNPNLQQQHFINQQQQQQSHHQQQQQHSQLLFKPQQTTKQKSTRRQRASKKSAANTMIAMSLPASMNPIQVQGVPIPFVSSNSNHIHAHNSHHQAASLSSSFNTGSPLSSFASTALYCSKASGVTSASSSAASSLSSSDSSSSCGEILMGDNEFNQSLNSTPGAKQHSNRRGANQNHTKNTHNHHNYHLTHQQFEPTNQISNNSKINHKSVARYIAATSSGPQLVTMTTNSSVASASSPIDSSLRAGHVIHAVNNGAIINASTSTSFDPRHLSIGPANGNIHQQATYACQDGHSFNLGEGCGGSFSGDNQISGSPSSCPPLIMTRVQPMILNSLSTSTHQSIMAFQQAIASSPTSSSSSYSRHRELHKTLEKNRRAHLRHCFELLRTELPASECVDKKTSHINIIKSAIRYVLVLRQQECEIDHELQRLTGIKNDLTENLSKLRNANQTQQGATAAEQHEPPNEQNQLKQEQQLQQQSPAPEQHLSFLLSQSKID